MAEEGTERDSGRPEKGSKDDPGRLTSSDAAASTAKAGATSGNHGSATEAKTGKSSRMRDWMGVVVRRLESTFGVNGGEKVTDAERVLRAFVGFSFLGVLTLLALCVPAGDFRPVTVGVLLAGAATVVGGLVGFLFGIPRSETVDSAGRAYRPNTNLEQLSDWLTKILVGVGLTQMRDISASFIWLVERVGPAVATGPLGNVTAGAVMTLYAVCGFTAGYLLTRLYLTGAFQRAESPNTSARPGPAGRRDPRSAETRADEGAADAGRAGDPRNPAT